MTITFNAQNIQSESSEWDSSHVVHALQEVSNTDRMFSNAFRTLGSVDDLLASYWNVTAQNLPQYKADAVEPDRSTIEVNKVLEQVGLMQEELSWPGMDYRRIQKDPINISERERLLGPAFAEKRDVLNIAGNTIDDLTVSGLLTTARATDAALTNTTATTFVGWTAMIGELLSDAAAALKGLFNPLRAGMWIGFTPDVDALTYSTYSTSDQSVSVRSWLQGMFPGGVFNLPGLGGTVSGTTGKISADGTQNIILGTNSPETSAMFQTGLVRKDVSRHVEEKRFWYQQRFLPVTLRTAGFHWENAVTVS